MNVTFSPPCQLRGHVNIQVGRFSIRPFIDGDTCIHSFFKHNLNHCRIDIFLTHTDTVGTFLLIVIDLEGGFYPHSPRGVVLSVFRSQRPCKEEPVLYIPCPSIYHGT